jgi:hypothetical protein
MYTKQGWEPRAPGPVVFSGVRQKISTSAPATLCPFLALPLAAARPYGQFRYARRAESNGLKGHASRGELSAKQTERANLNQRPGGPLPP